MVAVVSASTSDEVLGAVRECQHTNQLMRHQIARISRLLHVAEVDLDVCQQKLFDAGVDIPNSGSFGSFFQGAVGDDYGSSDSWPSSDSDGGD